MTVTKHNPELTPRTARRIIRRRPWQGRAVVAMLAILIGSVVFATPVKYIVLDLFGLHSSGETEKAFLTYRLMSERDSLVAANQRLQEEVESLKSRIVPTGAGFEASVRAQLEELHGVIAAATELDLSEGAPTAIARKGKKGKQEVASALKNTKSSKAGSHKKLGVGGQEVECGGSVSCPGEVRKQNISLEIGPSFYEPEVSKKTHPLAPTQEDLVQRIATLSVGLRALPIGYPVEGEITSHYGHRTSPFTRRASFHEGLDISIEKGGDVLVTGDGVVSNVKYDRAYGWLVDVSHSSTVVSRYAHLSKALVKIGQSVDRGDRIALSGSTGRSTGPHLHYEVRVNGRARNPKAFALLPEKLAKIL